MPSGTSPPQHTKQTSEASWPCQLSDKLHTTAWYYGTFQAVLEPTPQVRMVSWVGSGLPNIQKEHHRSYSWGCGDLQLEKMYLPLPQLVQPRHRVLPASTTLRCPSGVPNCCQGGWKITLAGSQFLSSEEQRYTAIEGEALAVVCALEQTQYFTQGCDNLIVVTDHQTAGENLWQSDSWWDFKFRFLQTKAEDPTVALRHRTPQQTMQSNHWCHLQTPFSIRLCKRFHT